MVSFESAKPRKSQEGAESMQIRDEAMAAFELLPPDLKRQIGADAVPVLRTAIQLQSNDSDPLIDGTIDTALAQHGIEKVDQSKRYAAYRRMLIGHFTFGADAVGRRARKQAGGQH
jgi:hypothetical protein